MGADELQSEQYPVVRTAARSTEATTDRGSADFATAATAAGRPGFPVALSDAVPRSGVQARKASSEFSGRPAGASAAREPRRGGSA